jgi:methylaspartate ammonia-lyase
MTALTIVDVLATPGLGGFFFDDQAAIKAGAPRDGYAYASTAVTEGYAAVREPAEAACVMLVLNDGYVATGDAASVQYSGVGGREPRLTGRRLAERVETELRPHLLGASVSCFRAATIEADVAVADLALGRAAAYGISQALLDAAAHAAGHHIMGRVIKDEWGLPGTLAPVPLYAQTGEDRRDGVDKMLLKRVPVLPHGLVNTRELVGPNGQALVDYLLWIRRRFASIVDPHADYLPLLHLDVYGQVGVEAAGAVSRTADILMRMEEAAGPHQLRVEHPIDAGSRDAQIETLAELRRMLRERGSSLQLVADEWANTLEDIAAFVDAGAADLIQIKTPDLGSLHNTVDAVAICKAGSVGPVLGGSCSETDRSALATTHIGIATDVAQMLAKPGMGVDEGLAIVTNEMDRAVRLDQRLMATRSAEPIAS